MSAGESLKKFSGMGEMVKQSIMGERFGKSELPLNEVHYMKKLMTSGDSVCRLRFGDEVTGTGFVLFGNYILTNAHLLTGFYEESGFRNKLTEPVEVLFNYEDPSFKHLPVSFQADGFIYDMDFHMDYALLQLDSAPGQTVPPGLMKEFGPKPEHGEVCIIGHPDGGVKKMDLTQIIEKNERQKCVMEKIQACKGSANGIIMNKLKGQNIEELYSSDYEITYDSSMLHGSLGSPLFDHEGRVVGLHSAGFVYNRSKGPKDHSIIEFAHPILEILQNLVVSLERRGDVSPEFIKEKAEGNPHVEKVLREAAAASRGKLDLREPFDESELPLDEVYCMKKFMTFCDFHLSTDYSVLPLKPKPAPSVPSKLRLFFGSKPECDEVCIIRRPEGRVKRMDLTQIQRMDKIMMTSERNIISNSSMFLCPSDSPPMMSRVASRGNMDKLRAAVTAENQRAKSHDEEIHVLQEFSRLREMVKQAFPDETFQRTMGEGFGKTELPLNEVYNVKKLVGYGDSVCRLMFNGQPRGTGFVLFENFILTNAHLLKDFYEERANSLTVTVEAQFNYEDPSFKHLPVTFKANGYICFMDSDMDYAVLWLFSEPGQTVPPGLLPHFGPKPEHGEVCIIGHPGGKVKKMDLTWIIKKTEREASVEEKLKSFDEPTKEQIKKQLEDQKIKEMYNSDDVITYHTSMFAGSSGSPLLDAECSVVGLHSGGFPHSLSDKPEDGNIIEFARPVLEIIENLVVKHDFPSWYIRCHAGNNEHVKRVLEAIGK